MKLRNIFGLLLRLAAMWTILWGLWYILGGIVYFPSWLIGVMKGATPFKGSYSYFGYGIPIFLVGMLFLRYAEVIVSFSYGKPEKEPPPLPDETSKN